jgi:ribosomal protein S18 acetylase RimI-like enzyme
LTTYRELNREDIRQVQEVALKAWRRTYRHIYSPSSIEHQVSNYYSTENLEGILQGVRQKKLYFQVAIDNERIVGYVNGGRNGDPFLPKGRAHKTSGWELFRIYLLPDYIGRGIGKELLHLWEGFLREKKARRYSVYIEPKNKLGNEFYLRNGFVRANKLDRGFSSPCLVKKL